jgi:hypothetical protein
MPNLLQPLANAALLGISRKEPAWPAAEGQIGEILTAIDTTDAPLRLLRTAGVLSYALEAGAVPAPPAEHLPEAPEETLSLKPASAKLHGLLHSLLSEKSALLVEAVQLFATRGYAFPPDLLPTLLDASLDRPALREALSKLPGTRLPWLISLNPEWEKVRLVDTEKLLSDTIWQEGNVLERIAWLKQTRQTDAVKAREAFVECATKEAARDRLEFLICLETGLSSADEPFLESLLKDKAKTVRQQAAKMLSCLPESAYAARMAEYWEPLITAPLTIEPPEAFSPAWATDGIEEKTAATGQGHKGYWINQLAAQTPLSYWNRFAKAPSGVLELIKKSPWQKELITAFEAAAVTQKNSVWAMALLEANPRSHCLLVVLSAADREAWLLGRIAELPITEIFAHALNLPNWSNDLSRALIGELKKPISSSPYDLYQQIPALAYKVTPATFAEALEGWNEPGKILYFGAAITNFLQTVQSRHTLHEELH